MLFKAGQVGMVAISKTDLKHRQIKKKFFMNQAVITVSQLNQSPLGKKT